MTATPTFAQQERNDALRQLIPEEHYEPITELCDEALNVIVRLVDVFSASGETLVHSAAISNRFIATNFVRFRDSELSTIEVAAGSFMLAMKFREIKHPCVSDLARITAKTNEQIRTAEESVIIALDWDINITTGIFTLETY